MPGGGGDSGGGMVVQQPAPWAVQQAGALQERAANEATHAAIAQTETAFDAIRQQYKSAVQTLRPYTQEGLQSLNELNRYLGLSSYDPGKAPVAPTAPQGPATDPNSIFNQIQASRIFEGGKVKHGGLENLGNQYRSADLHAIVQGTSLNKYNGNAIADPTLQQLQDLQRTNPDKYNQLAATITDQNTNLWGQQDLAQSKYNTDLAAYETQKDQWDQAMALKQKYDALGPMTNAQINEALAQTPGYQFQLNQGLDAIQRAANKNGLLGSGRLLQSLVDYGSGLASQTYGSRLSQLANLAAMGQNAASGIANISNQVGQSLGQGNINLGDTIANGYLSAAQARADALVNSNMQYKIIGGGGGGGGGMGGIGQALGMAGSLFGGGGGGGAAGGLMGLFSSEALKNKISTPSKEEILDRVKALRIDRWQYKNIDETHIGPYAEEFRDQFGVGDGQSINLIDAIGVLFATVKALTQKIDDIQGVKNAS